MQTEMEADMQPETGTESCDPDSEAAAIEYDPWYKYGVWLLYTEMVVAIGVTLYSLYMAFTGAGGIGGH